MEAIKNNSKRRQTMVDQKPGQNDQFNDLVLLQREKNRISKKKK
jgi:hypothetical protein